MKTTRAIDFTNDLPIEVGLREWKKSLMSLHIRLSLTNILLKTFLDAFAYII